MEIEEVKSVAVLCEGILSTVVGRCVMCRGAVMSRGGETDGVLLPMQTRWVALVHRGCFDRFQAPGARRKVGSGPRTQDPGPRASEES